MRKTFFLYHFKIIFVSQLSFVVEKRLSDKIYIWGEPRIWQLITVVAEIGLVRIRREIIQSNVKTTSLQST